MGPEMVNKFRFAVVLLLAALIQSCVIHRIGFGGFQPDLLFVLAFYLGLKAPPRAVPAACVVVGLARDLFSVNRFGVSMLLCLLLGSAAFVARKFTYEERALARALAAFVFICFLNWTYGAVLLLVYPDLDFSYWMGASARMALATALLTPAACRALDGLKLIRRRPDF